MGGSWVSLAGASSLRAFGFAERSSEWQRTEFEWLEVGGEPSSTGDINEKPLHFNALRDRMVNRGRQEWTGRLTSRT